MNRLVSAEWDEDCYGNRGLLFKKTRGRLTLEDIEDYLRYSNRGSLRNIYVIIVNATEATIGGSGWDDGNIPVGDNAFLYPLEPEEKCPVCNAMLPPEYCPECGASLKSKLEDRS